jgi:hypothetical protein
MKKLGLTTHTHTKLPLLDEEGKLVLEPEVILEIITEVICARNVNKYLIKWRNLSKYEAT